MNDIAITFFDPICYLEAKHIRYSTEGPNTSPGWINLDCPWCGDTLQHLGINLETNACNCWRCGGKSIGKLVQLIEDCNWPQALAVMENYQNYSRPALLERDDYIPPRQITIPKEFIKIKEDNINGKVNEFLFYRGFNPYKIIEERELYQSMGFVGEYIHRILLPVYLHKQLVTFMTRDVTGKSLKPYIACKPKEEVIPIKHTLYGYDDVTPSSTVVLVEGPIDQWKLGRGSLATWGTGWTLEQIALLRSLHPKKVYTLFDNEEPAQASARRLSKAIWFCDAENLCLIDRNDPGELSPEEGANIMKELK